MVNRLKEEEYSERAIRNLVKLPENRRCINCNNLGPQYVCTTFLTFVCSNCSGVHREFTHRIKSISMAKFSEEEVSALQAGGNDRARQIYFKEWDPQRHSFPDSSNLHILRDFIKNVYVNRKYSGERSTDTLPTLRLNEKESSNESEKGVAYRGGLRSPRSENKYERHHGEVYCSDGRSGRTSSRYYYDERRSPRYSVENSRYGGSRRSFAHIEIVDDRIRDDGYQSRRLSKRESTIGTNSLENQNKLKRPGSPVMCSLKNMLRETVPQTQLVEDVKPTAGDSGPNGPNQDSLEGSSVKPKDCVSKGLIDVNSEPVVVAASSQSQQILSSKVDTNWDPFESSVKEAAPRSQVPATKTLEELLFELSVPSSVGPNTYDNILVGSEGNMPIGDATLTELDMTSVEVPGLGAKIKETDIDFTVQSSDGINVRAVSIRDGETKGNIADEQQLPSIQQTPVASITEFPVQSSDGITVQAVSIGDSETTVNIADGQELQNIQQQTPVESSIGSTPEKSTLPVGGLNFESQMSSLASHSEGSSSPSTVLSVVSQPAQDAHQCFSEEAKSIGRKELPADLFTVNFSSPGWHIGSYPTMGYNLHYRPNMMPVPSFANSSRSTNPFDLNDEVSEPNTLPMSLQAASPQSFHPSGFQTHYPGLMMSQSNVLSVPPGPPSFAALSLSTCMSRQQVHNGLPLSRVEANGAPEAIEANTFEPLSLNAAYSTPTPTPMPANPSSVGGNPFA